MKNKTKKVVIVSFILIYVLNSAAFAYDTGKYYDARKGYANVKLLSGTEKTIFDVTQVIARSTALGSAMCSITDQGKGVIRVFAETTMFKPVDWACLTVYLERWYEEEKSWKIVEEFEKEFIPEEEEELTTATFATSVSGQPMGYYYRVRAMHELEFDGDWYEARVTKTDGLLMEYTP